MPQSRVKPNDSPPATGEALARPEGLKPATAGADSGQDAASAAEENNPGLEDARWVADVLAGDRDRFERLVRKYQRQALVVSYRLLGNHEDARDVIQDAFVKAYRSLDTLERPAAFGGWLMRIVTNLSLNFRRGRRLRIAQPIEGAVADQLGSPSAAERPMRGHGSDSLAQSGSPERAAEGKELGDALQAALDQLPEKQRQALIMFTIQDLPQKEVAESLGCSVEAVKWHVFQGRKKLKELLKDML